jgi:hypothetical protein
MAMENLKPTIWTRFLQIALQKILIFANLTNQNYTGEARVGGSVKFLQIGEVAVNDYTAGSDMTFETLDDASLTMTIAQQKYMAFTLEQVDTTFIPVDVMNAGINRGAYRVRETIDQYISGKYAQAGVTYGSAATPKTTSSGTVIQHLAEFYETMTEANIPLENRWAACPPWVFTKLTLAEVTSKTPNSDTFADGHIGGVVGFGRLYLSNNVTKIGTTAHTILASSGNEAIGYAGAVNGDIRIRQAEKRRAVNVDGLWVYDSKVIRPDMLACMYSTETAN